MKTILPVSLALAIVAVGCNKQADQTASSTNATAEGRTTVSSVVSAPVDYLGALGRGQQKATKEVDIASLQSAIQLFQVDKGRLPRDLNELVQEKFIPQIPNPPYGTKLDYNPTTGEVKVVKQ